mgnify:CR=1 FL=1
MNKELTLQQIDEKAAAFEKRLKDAGFKIEDIVEYAQLVTVGVLRLIRDENIDLSEAIENLSNMDI